MFRVQWVNPRKEGTIIDRKCDWVVFDATLENATSGRLLVVEKLLCSLKRQSLLSFDGQKTVIPPSMTFIFECDTIQNLSPSSVSDLALIYVDDRCLDIDREFNNWIATLNTYSSFFGKNSMSSHVNQLYKKLIKPVLEFTTQGATENKLVLYLSSKYLLMHFMSLFEIFLSSIRETLRRTASWLKLSRIMISTWAAVIKSPWFFIWNNVFSSSSPSE